jgi:hypothetical protein
MASTDLPITAYSRARRAYELGRLRLGLRTALVVMPMIGLSLLLSTRPALSWSAGALLFALVAALSARGGAHGRAVVPGLLAGSLPLLLPALLRTSGHCCIGGACWSMCMAGCIVGGLFAGVAIGLVAASEPERSRFLLASTAIAGLAGALGCVMAGALGIAGMALAVLASSWPIALAVPSRAGS